METISQQKQLQIYENYWHLSEIDTNSSQDDNMQVSQELLILYNLSVSFLLLSDKTMTCWSVVRRKYWRPKKQKSSFAKFLWELKLIKERQISVDMFPPRSHSPRLGSAWCFNGSDKLPTEPWLLSIFLFCKIENGNAEELLSVHHT